MKDVIKPSERPYNKGRIYGRGIIKESLKKLGAARSVVVDKDNNILCGNQVYQVCKELGFNVQFVDVTGDTLVVVRRTDVSIKETKGKEIALVDNVSSENNLTWDADNVIHDAHRDYAFEPMKWGGSRCVTKELDLPSFFKENADVKKRSKEDTAFSAQEPTLFDSLFQNDNIE